MDDAPPPLQAEIAALRGEVARLNRHRFVRELNSPWRSIGWTFLRGVALGVGTVIGGTLGVSVLVYLLSEADFIPVLGRWASEIAAEIRARN